MMYRTGQYDFMGVRRIYHSSVGVPGVLPSRIEGDWYGLGTACDVDRNRDVIVSSIVRASA